MPSLNEAVGPSREGVPGTPASVATSATSPTLSATEITTPRFRLRRAHDAAALRAAAAAELPDQPVLIVTRTANTRSLYLPPTSASDRGTFEACEAEQILAMTVPHSFLAG